MNPAQTMKFLCCDEHRRALVRQHPRLNGIDYLEVLHYVEPVDVTDFEDLSQRKLIVHFVKDLSLPAQDVLRQRLEQLKPAEIRIEGGERTKGIKVQQSALVDTDGRLALHVQVSQRGDFSTYTLAFGKEAGTPLSVMGPDGEMLDPVLTRVDFSFKVGCLSELDCRPPCGCDTVPAPLPELDHLAKDFASFRQLLLDRFAALVPEWTERNPADLGITLVELLAYAGDYLSYRQDAIATEAYLGTAQRRVSVRRHSRMLDYPMHEGCNARAWVQVQVSEEAPKTGVILPRFYTGSATIGFVPATHAPVPEEDEQMFRTRFFTRVADRSGRWLASVSCVDCEDDAQVVEMIEETQPEVFEPLRDAWLYWEHNEIRFHTWGDRRCCLPRGATRATLKSNRERPLRLVAGDVLVLAEVKGPRTGLAADADPAKRHVVRLINVRPSPDGNQTGPRGRAGTMEDPLTGECIVEVEWDQADALPFPLCVSSVREGDETPIHDVSVAWGNLVPVDHGRTMPVEALPEIPRPDPALAPLGGGGCGHCGDEVEASWPARYRPVLKEGPLVHAGPLPEAMERMPAARLHEVDWAEVLPAIVLGDDRGNAWAPQRDLLSSDAIARDFVAEMENDGRAVLRFGDDVNGLRPAERSIFHACYRVGQASQGNVGAGTIQLIALPGEGLIRPACDRFDLPRHAWLGKAQMGPRRWITKVTNPLPARGGLAPEAIEEVRQYAPQAFHEQRRAVTPLDYAKAAERHPAVQRAQAQRRWTGSWDTIFLTVDRKGGFPVDEEFEQVLRAHLESWRLAGHDLEISGPSYLAVELEMEVCVQADYYKGPVLGALMDRFSTRTMANGALGFFHPDHFTFGQPLIVSQVIEAAQAIPGVAHVRLHKLGRFGQTGTAAIDDGFLKPGAQEIIRLDNNPNFLDRGVLRFRLHGGR